MAVRHSSLPMHTFSSDHRQVLFHLEAQQKYDSHSQYIQQPEEGFTNTLKLFFFCSFPPFYFVQPLELYNSQEPIFFWQKAAWVIIQLSSVIHLKDDTGNCMICKEGNCHILNSVSLWVQARGHLHTYRSSHTHPKLYCFMNFKSWMLM